MSCAACGAPLSKRQRSCAICGYVCSNGAEPTWDRRVEAAAFEDLVQTLEEGETLLGTTRGRLAGSWSGRLALNPQALLWRFANLGITGDKLVLQPVQPGTGRAASDRALVFPVEEIHSISLSDADPMEPGRTARMVVQLRTGDSIRLRASGRLADSARRIVKVWESLTAHLPQRKTVAEEQCIHCGRALDRPYRFCPFCGQGQGDENEP
jgi:hypothetical protein